MELISNHNKPIRQLRIIGAVELLIAIGCAIYSLLRLRYLNAHPDIYWEGWDFTGPGLVMWTGVFCGLASLGSLVLTRWRYALHAPIVLWGLSFLILVIYLQVS